MKIPRNVLYHARDTDPEAFYICHPCIRKNIKEWRETKLKDTVMFAQGGHPVTTPYVCSECNEETQCFRFSPDKEVDK